MPAIDQNGDPEVILDIIPLDTVNNGLKIGIKLRVSSRGDDGRASINSLVSVGRLNDAPKIFCDIALSPVMAEIIGDELLAAAKRLKQDAQDTDDVRE